MLVHAFLCWQVYKQFGPTYHTLPPFLWADNPTNILPITNLGKTPGTKAFTVSLLNGEREERSYVTQEQPCCRVQWGRTLPHASPAAAAPARGSTHLEANVLPSLGCLGSGWKGKHTQLGWSRQAVSAGHKISSLKPPAHSSLSVPCLLIGSYKSQK